MPFQQLQWALSRLVFEGLLLCPFDQEYRHADLQGGRQRRGQQ